MSSLNFDFMFVGNALLDEAACCTPGFRRPLLHKPSPSYPLHPEAYTIAFNSVNPYSGLRDSLPFYDNLSFYDRDFTSCTGRALQVSPSPRISSCRSLMIEHTLPPIYEEDEEGEDYYDDDDDDVGAFNAPILRFFKSCLVQFAYMMPTEKALKSPPRSP